VGWCENLLRWSGDSLRVTTRVFGDFVVMFACRATRRRCCARAAAAGEGVGGAGLAGSGEESRRWLWPSARWRVGG
jgi:hypothetical protein